MWLARGDTGGGTRVCELYNNNTTRQIVDRGGAFNIHDPEYKWTLA